MYTMMPNVREFILNGFLFGIVLFLISPFAFVTQARCQPSIEYYQTFDEFKGLLSPPDKGLKVINFWATWCKPCVEELPYFEALHEKYDTIGSVQVILVSLDFPTHIEKRLLPFIEKNRLQSRLVALLDVKANNWIDQISTDWSGAIPATLILSKNERLFFEKSYHSMEDIELDFPIDPNE